MDVAFLTGNGIDLKRIRPQYFYKLPLRRWRATHTAWTWIMFFTGIEKEHHTTEHGCPSEIVGGFFHKHGINGFKNSSAG
jgi:hypothetical protein